MLKNARENVEYLLNYLNLLPILFTHIATKTVSLLFIEFEFLQITPSENLLSRRVQMKAKI